MELYTGRKGETEACDSGLGVTGAQIGKQQLEHSRVETNSRGIQNPAMSSDLGFVCENSLIDAYEEVDEEAGEEESDALCSCWQYKLLQCRLRSQRHRFISCERLVKYIEVGKQS